MNKIDWDAAFSTVTKVTKCSEDYREKVSERKWKERRKEVEEAFEATRKTAENYPDLDEKKFRKQVYRELIPGIWPIIITALLSVIAKFVIEYLIDLLYPPDDEEKKYDEIYLPSK